MDLGEFEADNSVSCRLASAIPDVCKTEDCCLGIDEAGRGPVLGPMVYGICFCPIGKKEDLKDLKVAGKFMILEDIDRGTERASIPQAGRGQELCRLGSSDPLTQHYLYQHAAEVFKHILYYTHTHTHTDTEKDRQRANKRTHTQMILTVLLFHRSKYNLNALSHDAAIGLVQFALDSGVQLKEVFVDTVGPAEKYQEKLSQRFPGVEVTVRPKADSLFPIVSAASICAKGSESTGVKGFVPD
ncbi:unnamed protein product [Coregonus sp. 'balchen']|nr:unnamed protein product [Coregonus sp. 'balchen']